MVADSLQVHRSLVNNPEANNLEANKIRSNIQHLIRESYQYLPGHMYEIPVIYGSMTGLSKRKASSVESSSASTTRGAKRRRVQ
jgi:hypothetical protein